MTTSLTQGKRISLNKEQPFSSRQTALKNYYPPIFPFVFQANNVGLNIRHKILSWIALTAAAVLLVTLSFSIVLAT